MIVVVIYMLCALSWWSILLFKMNQEKYELSLIHSDPVQKELAYEEFTKTKKMVLGEGVFFGLALIIGIYFLYRSYKQEIEGSKRQNNFLLSVTHELKTPLSVLSLTNQTLQSRDLPKEKQQEILKDAGLELERLEDLVNNILTATKIDHQYNTQVEAIKINAFLEELILKLSSRYKHQLELQRIDDYVILADKELFEIAVKNLIDNACKYSPNAETVQIVTKINHGQNTLSIIDNGEGIKQEDIHKIFDKFYRAGEERIRKSKGSGLGLYLVKEILSIFNASIQLVSNSNKGSTFVIRFN